MTRNDKKRKKSQLKELFIEDLGQVTGGAKKPPLTTLAIGEEDATTMAIGEEDSHTTMALGEEEPLPTV